MHHYAAMQTDYGYAKGATKSVLPTDLARDFCKTTHLCHQAIQPIRQQQVPAEQRQQLAIVEPQLQQGGMMGVEEGLM